MFPIDKVGKPGWRTDRGECQAKPQKDSVLHSQAAGKVKSGDRNISGCPQEPLYPQGPVWTTSSLWIRNIRISSLRWWIYRNIPIGLGSPQRGEPNHLPNRENHRMFALQSGQVITDQNAKEIARSLPHLGSGVSRSVYDLGDVVLKVDDGSNYAGNCASEVAAWEEYEGTEYEHLFARIFAHGRGWIIAEKAETDYSLYRSQAGRDVINQLEWIGIGDLHEGNIGFRSDGTGCAIDYAMNCHRGESSDDCMSSDPCECCDHDCRDCFPHGCECCCSLHRGESSICATYEGCNAELCAYGACLQNGSVHVPEEGAAWFGFRYGVVTPPARGQGAAGRVRTPAMVHFCEGHAPAPTAPRRGEIMGQRGFLIWSGLMLLPWEG
jgi:hypothetical protein